MPELPNPVDLAVPAFVALVLVEMIVARFRDRSRYCPRDTLTSLLLGFGSTIAGVLAGGLVFGLATWVHQFRLFDISYAWYWFVLAFVLDDLAYYVFHRSAHRVRWFWASHVIHHSSQHYNLSTALRQTWTGFFSLGFLFRLPLFLIGFPPAMIFFVAGVNLVYQFWIHTEVIGRMPRWFEAVMNTPSHHRVHHATNARYLDRNYAGVFIVWDRLFGTFEAERDDDRPRYGIVHNLPDFNVLRAAFHEWIGIAKDVWAAPDWRARLGYMWMPPGWSHDGTRDTSETIKARWAERQNRGGTVEEADIVVIGAGSGGSAAAGRLSEGGKYTVAVLEAGGRNTSFRTLMPGGIAMQTPQTNWGFETVPQPGLNGRRGYQPRGRGLGGSSAINAMLYIRGHRWDYDNWAALGCPGWGWSDVLPVFRRSEANERGADAWHGGDGPLHVSDQRFAHAGSHAFIEAAEQLQIARNDDFNGARQEGVGLYQVTQKDGQRWTAAHGYLTPRDNLKIVCDAHVERVLFEDGRAWGVAYAQGGQSKMIRARRAVVLAGGVFATPQLLMLSGIGPGEHLQDLGIPVRVDRGEVGGNLQDHLDYVAAFETPGSLFLGRSLAGSLKGLAGILRWKLNRTGMMTSPYAEGGAFLRTDPSLPAPDIQLHFLIAIVEDHGRAKVKAHGYSCHACVLRPESRGTVRLASPDARAAPLIDPQFLSDPRDVASLMRGTRLMYRILEQAPLAKFGGRDRTSVNLHDDAALERLIRARADTIYHPVGTARMGSDDDAVCDPQLRVRGVDGLYVADASIMPRLIGGNTNAPSIMIGERCADFVRADL